MGVYQRREDYERATVLGHYEAVSGATPVQGGGLPSDSPYQKYHNTGLGMKLRMHPLAATLILKQLETLDRQNEVIKSQIRRLNDRICQLPGLSEPACRKDQKRVYYSNNILYLDRAKAGFSRDAVAQGLSGRGRRRLRLGVSGEPNQCDLLRNRNGGTIRSDIPSTCPAVSKSKPNRSCSRCSARRPRVGRSIHHGLREGLGESVQACVSIFRLIRSAPVAPARTLYTFQETSNMIFSRAGVVGRFLALFFGHGRALHCGAPDSPQAFCRFF